MRKPTNLLIRPPVVFVTLFFITLFATYCSKTPSNDQVVAAYLATHPLTQSIYTVDTTTSPPPGIILTTPYNESILPIDQSTGFLLIMDQSGKALQEKYTPGTAFCLNRWIINGQIRYTYLVNDPGALRLLGVDQNAGYAIVADSSLNTLQRINFTPFDSLFQAGQALDVHDFILLSDSDYITLSYINKYVTNIPARLTSATSVPVLAPLIEEVKNGTVVWHWDGSADTSFYANSVEGNIFTDSLAAQDYMHMNSMFVDPRDNNLICSMRNQDQVIKINRQTGAIVWRLGGANSDFALTPNQVFLRQHNATLVDSNRTLLIFDDGDSTLRPYSRVVEFQLDEANKVITSSTQFKIPEPFTLLTGSVQKLGPNYFIGGGTANYLLEINYTTGQKISEFIGTEPTYRAYKYLQ
ncbi:MAG: aryl-sulfate sulfotransferase [Puia sp.]|nr:aryl-sulfate sulfotransferase [Puia sp.]